MKQVNKKDVIQLLEQIAIYLELKGENPFRISAYRKAAQALEIDERALSEIDDFTQIKGIGKGTAKTISEYIKQGVSTTLTELEADVPKGLIPLLELPGLGGKKLARLYQELNIVDQESLKRACEAGEVSALKGFGKKTEQNILKAIVEAGSRPDRLPIDDMLQLAKKLETYLDKIDEIERFSIAGSMRRMRETIKDLDFIIATNQPRIVKESLLNIPDLKEVISAGDTKVSIVLSDKYDVSVDFRIVTDQQFPTTLHHFTGSKDHNVAMRQRAKEQGEKISEYGVESLDTGEIKTFETEEAFFNHFGLNNIPPELREAQGEIEAFENHVSLIEEEQIKGDLHMHTTWSDGGQSIEEMVQFALERNYEYIAITDHSKFLRVANGLNETRLSKQREEIERLRQLYPEISILAGVEMDILPDGRLDFDDDFLQEMDFVIAAIHSSFNQSEEEIMNRLNLAMENPYVKLIAHPTGRIIGKREGYQVNLDHLIDKAKETNTILELNANPKRFDLSAEWVKKAQDKGVKIAINTDAHNKDSLDFMKQGVRVARRGWLKPETVVNTWSLDKLQAFFSKKENR
ncbi:DNA polymerase/3'-5' exonuclease PolX [Amphibacillus sp. MSJ-3]|uniref:DNA polymerase/3'-5' exonuclease PolX n=1 Tax=Amphibacillus sp. MSJ-3 TaxID=2841505 RepID=UPI001C0E9833|nr:DNA polymerase/3'-5' exonuclease PolX [Amphibacillus sp. MSJ-3]MBU5593626.1 DNA polymerase/3'-5' exonuclease PolX [Amphibacillus sp. MSJ-3]